MREIDVEAGTEEWLKIRAKYNTASEAPAMAGVSPYVKRNELLHMKATGDEREFSDFVQTHIIDKGHGDEARTRPIAEAMAGEDLFPVVGVDDDDYLLASFDGITLSGKIIWENKQPSKEKLEAVNAGRVPECDWPQIVQQFYVNDKAEKCLYTLSDGTEETPPHVWVTRDMVDFDALIAGWRQFDEERKNYTPTEPEPDVVGKAPESLPALRIEVSGEVTASNLPEFKQQAMHVLDNIKTDLQTDEDFANAELTVKWSKEVESRLEAEKRRALSQTASIEELFLAIDEIKEYARQKRLNLEKQVKGQKDQRRGEILHKAQTALSAHIGQLNQTLGSDKVRMPEISADFAGAMKGKRTIASLQDAADTELARAKIEANQIADNIRLNLKTLREDAKGYEGLFADAQQLVMKQNEDLKNLIKLRISEHQQAEKEREERIRAEEREAAAKAAAESKQAEPQPSQTPPAGRPEPAAGQSRDPVPSQQAAGPGRPSDDGIIAAVAYYYGTDESTAAEWILAMDFEQLKQKVAA